MKTRELKDLRKKDLGDLDRALAEKRTEVMNLRFSLATGALENPSRLGAAKRDVARMLTVIGEKRASATPEASTAAVAATPAKVRKAARSTKEAPAAKDAPAAKEEPAANATPAATDEAPAATDSETTTADAEATE